MNVTNWSFQEVAGIVVPIWAATLIFLYYVAHVCIKQVIGVIKTASSQLSNRSTMSESDMKSAHHLFMELVGHEVADANRGVIIRKALALVRGAGIEDPKVKSIKSSYAPDPKGVGSLKLPCFYNETMIIHIEGKLRYDGGTFEQFAQRANCNYNLVVDVKNELAQFIIVN